MCMKRVKIYNSYVKFDTKVEKGGHFGCWLRKKEGSMGVRLAFKKEVYRQALDIHWHMGVHPLPDKYLWTLAVLIVYHFFPSCSLFLVHFLSFNRVQLYIVHLQGKPKQHGSCEYGTTYLSLWEDWPRLPRSKNKQKLTFFQNSVCALFSPFSYV